MCTLLRACGLFGASLWLGAVARAEPLAADHALADEAAASQPIGLAMVWRIDGHSNDLVVPTRATHTFSADGRLIGVLDAHAIRAISAADPQSARAIPHDFGRRAHSLAVSRAGLIAAGHVGGIRLYKPGTGLSSWLACVDPCGPVLALAFSPDGTLLAYQGSRGLDDRLRGLGSVVVLNAKDGSLIAELPAVAAKAFVAFSADGSMLTAANATAFDDVEHLGLRSFRTSDWSPIEELRGSVHKWRAIGMLNGRRVGAYFHAGELELREIESGAAIWRVPLTEPSIDSPPAGQAAAMRLDLIELAVNGERILSYESVADRRAAGTIVIRTMADGRVEAMYDVADVTSLAIAPDSRSFVYSTGLGRTYRVMARVPSHEEPADPPDLAGSIPSRSERLVE